MSQNKGATGGFTSKSDSVASKQTTRGRGKRGKQGRSKTNKSRTRTHRGSSRSRLKVKSSKKSGTLSRGGSSWTAGGKERRVILNGEDLTPKPLLRLNTTVSGNGAPKKAQNSSGGGGGQSKESAAPAKGGASVGSMQSSKTGMMTDDDRSTVITVAETKVTSSTGIEAKQDLSTLETTKVESEAVVFTVAQLQEEVVIRLQETPTIELFSMESLCVEQDTDLHRAVASRNKAYEAMLRNKSDNSDLWAAHAAQTFNNTSKNKEA